tara:strand:+ start:259 stop:561 length:303 start_codon:yes stop_codon:yes gene_type:complete
MKDSNPSLFIKDYMRRLSLKMTDKQYEVLEVWAKSESRTVENMAGMWLGEGPAYHLCSSEACVLKLEGDRDQSNESKYQYYTDDELTELYKHLALQQDRD